MLFLRNSEITNGKMKEIKESMDYSNELKDLELKLK